MNEIQETHKRLEAACPRGNIMVWKAIKSLLFAVIAGAAYWASLNYGSDPTQAFMMFTATLVIIFYAFESKEVELAGILTIILEDGNDDGD